jgi:hypothetical protein
MTTAAEQIDRLARAYDAAPARQLPPSLQDIHEQVLQIERHLHLLALACQGLQQRYAERTELIVRRLAEMTAPTYTRFDETV